MAVLLIVALPMALAFEGQTTNAVSLTVKDIQNRAQLLERLPSTIDEVDANILPTRQSRFILYTKDGQDVMWGAFSDGYFRGQDNHGKYTWGIYGQNVFAGLYEGKFFWGKYRNGNWKAYGLFDKKQVSGKFIVFPSTPLLQNDIEPEPKPNKPLPITTRAIKINRK